MKVVLDTNVLISGLMLPDSVPGNIVRAWRAAKFDLVLSEPMLEEIERVLAYRKIHARIGWDKETIRRFVLLLRFKSDVVDLTGISVEVASDPADSLVLATLLASQAECLVSGDKDLLALGKHYPVLTPTEFARRL